MCAGLQERGGLENFCSPDVVLAYMVFMQLEYVLKPPVMWTSVKSPLTVFTECPSPFYSAGTKFSLKLPVSN